MRADEVRDLWACGVVAGELQSDELCAWIVAAGGDGGELAAQLGVARVGEDSREERFLLGLDIIINGLLTTPTDGRLSEGSWGDATV